MNMNYLFISIFTLLVSAPAFSGTAADKECIEWVLSQFPEPKIAKTYVSEHDLIVEEVTTPDGPVNLIHTHTGSMASLPHKSFKSCQVSRHIFDGQEVKGISGFLNSALQTKISGLFVQGGSRWEGVRFLQNMPAACKRTSYPNLTSNINAVCRELSNVPMATAILNSTTSVCKTGP